MRSTFSVLTQDSPGVLMRISSMIYRRNFNIVSLSVSQTTIPEVSRFTITIDGDEWALDQVSKQLRKIVEVLTVENLNNNGKFVERRLSLIKVQATAETRPHVLQIADVFRCRVVDMGSDALTLEVTGDEGKVEACIESLRTYGIIEVAGSGSVALSRAGFQINNKINNIKSIANTKNKELQKELDLSGLYTDMHTDIHTEIQAKDSINVSSASLASFVVNSAV